VPQGESDLYRFPAKITELVDYVREYLRGNRELDSGLSDSLLALLDTIDALGTDRDRTLEDFLSRGGGASVPFIVVANDGTGDFDDPALAIASVASGETAVIYVKNTGTSYSTAAADVAGKRIVLWGETALPRFPSSGLSGPYWTLGSSNFSTSSSTRLYIRGMTVDSSATAFGMTSGMTLTLENANIGSGSTLRADAGTLVSYKALFGIHSTSYTGRIDAWDSLITLPNTTTTVTNAQFTWQNCFIFPGGGSTHFTLAQSAGSPSNASVVISGCTFGEFNEFILSGWNQATFTGNTNGASVSGGALGGRLTTLTCTGCDHLIVDALMWGTNLTIAASQRYDLRGLWYVTTVAANGGRINATFDGDKGIGSFPDATMLTLSGDNNVASVTTNYGSTQGMLLSGDRNTVMISGTNTGTDLITVSGGDNYVTTAHAAADVNDTGAGNTIASNP
jgi:hypothetical protein